MRRCEGVRGGALSVGWEGRVVKGIGGTGVWEADWRVETVSKGPSWDM